MGLLDSSATLMISAIGHPTSRCHQPPRQPMLRATPLRPLVEWSLEEPVSRVTSNKNSTNRVRHLTNSKRFATIIDVVIVSSWLKSMKIATQGFGMSIFIFAASTSVTIAQNLEVITSHCNNSSVRETCHTTCAHACSKNAEFLANNADYCLKDGMLATGSSVPLPDEPLCSSVFSKHEKVVPKTGIKTDRNPGVKKVGGAKGTEFKENVVEGTEQMEQTGLTADCAINVDPFDRADCEAEFPACANDTPTLLKNSKALIKNVQAEFRDFPAALGRDSKEIAKLDFKEIAKLDFKEIAELDQLCALTRDVLRDHYSASTKYAESILKLQDSADKINKCSKQIEEWLEDQTVQNDTLQDSIIRETQDDLKDLTTLMKNLSTLSTKLEEAGPKIYNIIRIHGKFCPADSQSRKKS